MEFAIQVNNPRYFYNVDEESLSINEILQDMFLSDTEYCILWWNHICIPLSYKYDVSVIFDDIVYMFKEVLNHKSGSLKIDWPSNTFRTDWNLSWNDRGEVMISTIWSDVLGGRSITNDLNSENTLKIKKIDFLCEWKMLILKIIDVVSASGKMSLNLQTLRKWYIL